MPSLRELRQRIKSVSGIRQITRAMEMVASTKLRRAQQRIESARPYLDKMNEILEHLGEVVKAREISHPLLETRETINRILIVATGSEKGLCGSYNANVIRAVEKRADEVKGNGIEVQVFPIGRKLYGYFTKRGWNVREEAHEYIYIDQKLPLELLQKLTNRLTNFYLQHEVDQVELIYTEFKNVLSFKVTSKQFLPIVGLPIETTEEEEQRTRDYIFEPEPARLLEALIPKYAQMMVFRMLADSLASEHGSRRAAMKNASENAGDMIYTLTIQRNKARQAAITKELLEIISGAEALKG